MAPVELQRACFCGVHVQEQQLCPANVCIVVQQMYFLVVRDLNYTHARVKT